MMDILTHGSPYYKLLHLFMPYDSPISTLNWFILRKLIAVIQLACISIIVLQGLLAL